MILAQKLVTRSYPVLCIRGGDLGGQQGTVPS